MHYFLKFNSIYRSFQLIIGITLLISSYSLKALAQENFIPPEVQKILVGKNLPSDSFAYSVMLLNPDDNARKFHSIGWNANLPMNPASTIKLLTTISALDQLGAEYRFKTKLYLKGRIERGVLEGHLYVKGFGDPKMVPESLLKLMDQLKSLGVNKINADISLDLTAYNPSVKDSAPNDGEESKSYNVSPNPLLYSFQTISFHLSSTKKNVDVSFTPLLANFKISNLLKIFQGDCIDWKKNITLTLTQEENEQWTANLEGKLPSKCNDVVFNVVSIPNDQFFKMGFISAWESVGGQWLKKPNFQNNKVPNDTPLILEYAGTSLTEAIIDTNKFSNNVMARHIFLTPALENNKLQVSTLDAISQTQKWLKDHQFNMSELILENGSGLSDIERISPQHMIDLLKYASLSKHNDIFISSLPIAGVDGTMRHRLVNQFKNFVNHVWHKDPLQNKIQLPEKLNQSGAYIKTGSLRNVRSVAGYVVSKTGKIYIVSSMVNHFKANEGLSGVNDALIIWLSEDGPLKISKDSKTSQIQ
jgi:D-alanyl-D-alanine carboxypeptidase/D-alanyl-D-alanine-endopeptidase (penicillin-binding protein 4)